MEEARQHPALKMAEEKKQPVSVDVGISARAEIKTEIPAASSGRALDALIDLIRPFSEARGLKADQIRLQREEVLLEIAKRAKRRLEAEGKSPAPVPNKFMVPFLERASLEELDSETLVDAWANLLSSASSHFDERMVRYISVLADLGPSQAKFLDYLARHNIDQEVGNALWGDAPLLVSDLTIAQHFRENFNGANRDTYLDTFYEEFDLPGSIVISATLFDAKSGFWDQRESPEGFGQAWGYSELETLDSLSIVRLAANSTFNKASWNLGVEYVVFTSFGVSFYNACAGVKELTEQELENLLTEQDDTSTSTTKA